MSAADLPKVGGWLRLDGDLVSVEKVTRTRRRCRPGSTRRDGALVDRTVTFEQIKAARVPESDGKGGSRESLAGLWGRWMQYASPRLRSAAFATKSLKPYAHQDEAVFDHMLPNRACDFC